ncbi:hypothetical protein [Burkholderia gladioli]|uniref:hypothetical protein n=1 Tax=Burkholderia gladioli TaxID=28095 RepID=UPI00164004A7|nr:hypothetical protein [Burkholderia gladioli]
MTMTTICEKEIAAIDLMDAYLQFLLAVTWQRRQGNGLERLIDLSQQVRGKVDASAGIFESDRERAIATSQILNSLQDARRPLGPGRRSHSLEDWTAPPSDVDLPRMHQENEDSLLNFARTLMVQVKRDFEARVPLRTLTSWVGGPIRAIGKDLPFPFHVPALADCIVYLASRPGHVTERELCTEVARYQQVAERLAANKKLIARLQIAAELRSTADEIRIQIDQSYEWDTLVDHVTDTSLKALDLYARMNLHGRVNDGRFSPEAMKTKPIPTAEFDRLFNSWFVRGLTLSFSGDDRETRAMRRSILDSERANVRVYGRPVLDSLVLLVPCDDRTLDIERQLALFLMRLDSKWRNRHLGPSESGAFFDSLPEGLRDLVANHGIRRKIVDTKKPILFCLAGLIAENLYRDRHSTNLKGVSPVRTWADTDDYVAALLNERGFAYSAETLRRGRPRFRREFLNRVPDIFGFDEPDGINDRFDR